MNLQQCSSNDCADCQLKSYYGEKYGDGLRGMVTVLNEVVENNDRQALNYVSNFVHALLATASVFVSSSTGGIH